MEDTYARSDAARPRPTLRAVTQHEIGSSASTGYRLGISRSYGYGESRPELRPVVMD